MPRSNERDAAAIDFSHGACSQPFDCRHAPSITLCVLRGHLSGCHDLGKVVLSENRHTQTLRLGKLGARLLARHHVARLLGDRTSDLGTESLENASRLVAREPREGARKHKGKAGERLRLRELDCNPRFLGKGRIRPRAAEAL